MAGLRQLRGRFYARINYQDVSGYKEKLIPLYVRQKSRASILMSRINDLERLWKNGQIELDAISINREPENIGEQNERFKHRWDLLIGQFYDKMDVDRKSEKTLKLYRLALTALTEYFSSKDISQIRPSDELSFMKWLNERYPNTATLNIRRRCIKSFLRWCKKNRKIREVPFEIEQIPTNRNIPKYFSFYDMVKILGAVRKIENLDLRDQLEARIRVHVETGLRIGELAQSYLDNGSIVVFKSKTKSQRRISVDPETEIYYTKAKLGQYSTNMISKNFCYILRDLGLYKLPSGEKRTFHALRHTATAITYLKTKDVYYCVKRCGHADIKTTEIYLRLFDFKQAERDFTPLLNERPIQAVFDEYLEQPARRTVQEFPRQYATVQAI